MSANRSNTTLFVIVFFLFIFGIAGAFFIGQSGLISIKINLPDTSQESTQDPPAAEVNTEEMPEDASVGTAQQDIPEDDSDLSSIENDDVLFAKKFERFLNRFLRDFTLEVREYKKFRGVLKEFKSPVNLENTEFAKESYDMFRQGIAPELRKKAHAVMLVFQDANEQVDILLMDRPKETQERLKKVWKQMEFEHVHALVGFFESEERLIKAYEELLKFYYVHSKNYTVNSAGKVIFTKNSYAEMEAVLLGKIDSIKAEQKAQLAKPVKKSASADN